MITPPWPDPVLQHAAESLAAGHPEPAYACLGDGVTDPDRREFYADVLGKIGERHVRMLEANANAAPAIISNRRRYARRIASIPSPPVTEATGPAPPPTRSSAC